MRIPFIYLGFEVGGNPWKKQFWESILNEISVRQEEFSLLSWYFLPYPYFIYPSIKLRHRCVIE